MNIDLGKIFGTLVTTIVCLLFAIAIAISHATAGMKFLVAGFILTAWGIVIGLFWFDG